MEAILDFFAGEAAFLAKYYKFYLNGTVITLSVSFFGVLFGTILGVILSLMKLSKYKIFKKIASAYIEVVRGTPLLVQVFIVFYGLPMLLPFELSRIAAGTVAILLNSAAYVGEIIRGGILSIDRGQMEAARSLGMKHWKAMWFVIIPQAFKNILPALGNEFIVLVKESAIISVVGIHDIMYNTDTIRGISYKPFGPLIYAAIIYFIITFTLSKILGSFERRLRAGDQYN